MGCVSDQWRYNATSPWLTKNRWETTIIVKWSSLIHRGKNNRININIRKKNGITNYIAGWEITPRRWDGRSTHEHYHTCRLYFTLSICMKYDLTQNHSTTEDNKYWKHKLELSQPNGIFTLSQTCDVLSIIVDALHGRRHVCPTKNQEAPIWCSLIYPTPPGQSDHLCPMLLFHPVGKHTYR